MSSQLPRPDLLRDIPGPPVSRPGHSRSELLQYEEGCSVAGYSLLHVYLHIDMNHKQTDILAKLLQCRDFFRPADFGSKATKIVVLQSETTTQ